jgi:hypothetical protein
MRPKAKFLTVVWGKGYIRRFAALALPSFLAPGNLPALAAACELEVLIMTARSDIAVFDSHAAFRRLREICTVRFIDIDDLIVDGLYGITLTLAYARAVIACGPGMLDTHFVFMNADFVLADGSLRALCRHILAGRAIVLAPSFRATAEDVEPRLRVGVDIESNELVVSPRELAGISLRHPHPTTIAKIVNQEICHSVHPNQFFWQVDNHTLLGRYFLIFMLCLKPERVIDSVNTFCDYGFIPEMCPSGDEAIMGDSDEFFMLELQDRDQETHLLRPGRRTEKQIARSLAQWTTAEHRRASGYDVVFHAGELPAALEGAKAEARAFIGRIGRKLGRPLAHEFHPYWIGGIGAFRGLLKARGLASVPKELATIPYIHRLRPMLLFVWRWMVQGIRSLLLDSRNLLLGRTPWVTPFHPDWLDYLHLRKIVAETLALPGARLLMVRDRSVLTASEAGLGASMEFATPGDVLRVGPEWLQEASGRYTHALIYLRRVDAAQARRLVEKSRLAMGPKGVCHVFIHRTRDDLAAGDYSLALATNLGDEGAWASRSGTPTVTPAQFLQSIRRWAPRAAAVSYAGGPLKRFNRRLLTRFGGQFERFGSVSILWLPVVLAFVLPLVALCNLCLRMQPHSREPMQACSSMLIRVDPH